MRKRASVVVAGLVQGVGFRWYTATRAEQRGVTGWVRNRPDGCVEAVFEGAASDVESMIEWCRTGPRHARVESVDVTWEEPEDLVSFDIGG